MNDVHRGVTRPWSVLCVLMVALAAACTMCGSAEALVAKQSCAQAVIDDWARGRLDEMYEIRCYRAALARLPEDVRIYSSAPDDIERALAGRIASPARKARARRLAVAKASPAAGSAGSGTPTPLLVGGLVVLGLAAVGAAGLIARRLRR